MTKIKKIFSGVTALTLALTCGCGFSMSASAELKEGDSKAYKGTGYMAKYEVLSVDKDGKTTVKVTLKNTGKKKINNWAVGFDDSYWMVDDVKYGRLFSSEYSYNTVIRDCGTNGSVAPNECVSFCFTMADKYAELPERLKIYSDINKSNTVEELNTAAKNCYNAISELLADEETMGTQIDECFKNGLFANSNSKDGMKTGFNYKYKELGDKVINAEASQYARGNISVYLGRTTYDGEDGFFIQVKDNKTGKVGQYPRPTDGTATWGTFDTNAPMILDQKTLNGDAKTVYNAVAEYFADLETEGYDVLECYNNGCFAKASTKEGLKIGQEDSLADGDKAIEDELKNNNRYYEGRTVYVGLIPNSKDKFGNVDFFVQVKDSTGRVGQYPNPTKDSATWGSPFKSEKVTVTLYDAHGSTIKLDNQKIEKGSTIPESIIASWNAIGESHTTAWIPYGTDCARRIAFSSIQSSEGKTIEEYIDEPILNNIDFYICTVSEMKVMDS